MPCGHAWLIVADPCDDDLALLPRQGFSQDAFEMVGKVRCEELGAMGNVGAREVQFRESHGRSPADSSLPPLLSPVGAAA